MWIVVRRDDANWEGSPVVSVGGEIDAATAPKLRDQLLELLHRQTPRLVLDLSQVTVCDSRGQDALVRTAQRAELLGGKLTLAAAPPEIADAIGAAALRRRVPIQRSAEATAPRRAPRIHHPASVAAEDGPEEGGPE